MTKKTVFVMVFVGDDETDVQKVRGDLDMLSKNYNGDLYLDCIDEGFGAQQNEKKS